MTHVLDARRTVDEIVYLAFKYRFEVLLHLTASHLDQDAHVHGTLVVDVFKSWADYFHFPIRDFVQAGCL